MATPHATSQSSPALPLRSALKDESDKASPSGMNKAVQIAEPDMTPSEDSPHKKQFSAGVGKRLSGRSPGLAGNSSRTSLISQSSFDGLSTLAASPSQTPEDTNHHRSHHGHHGATKVSQKMLAQIVEWIQRERAKTEKRKPRRAHHRHQGKSKSPSNEEEAGSPVLEIKRQRASSLDSDSSEVSLDRLQKIIDEGFAALGLDAITGRSGRGLPPKTRSSWQQLHRTASSDTECVDGDVLVPSCDAVLDNSKTMSYAGGKANTRTPSKLFSRRKEREHKAWLDFKNEVIRLAHTLRLKGWRRVPLDSGESISVERLSGALTNAVYVVSPPEDLATGPSHGKRRPTKVLLRIYGPQVEHLIDRENELGMLRRLSRKKIGPRLLGTFTNGRFEQFFNATTLTPANLREPETSKQIAKRMRELHDGVELLEGELKEGPGVWKNWDRWLDQVERAITFLDNQICTGDSGTTTPGASDAWKSRGLICGTEWSKFKAMVEQYREFLNRHYGGERAIQSKLVFAHNDTQYGNILRVRPDDEKSPLMEPSNEHKQLIVIDFEYAAANVPGLEFANHFTEWTYNYHDSKAPYACNTDKYPTPEQQHRFLKAYVDHRPQFPHAGTPKIPSAPESTTPKLQTANSSSSIAEFMLDARVPPGGWKEEEKKREEKTEQQIQELMAETRLWRIANSAQWVAWGIVQARIPGLETEGDKKDEEVTSNGGSEEEGGAASEEDEFDYLSYAQERALFFWGDCVLMGLVEKGQLPESIRDKIKLVDC